jgi:hypothetical protein
MQDASADANQSSALKHGGHVALKTRVNKKPSAASLRSPQRADPPPLPLGAMPNHPSAPQYPVPQPTIGSMPAYPPMPDVYGSEDPNQLHSMYYPSQLATTQGDMYPAHYIPTSDGGYM